jgi:hypothetical protein
MFVLGEKEAIRLQTDARLAAVPGVLTVTNQRVVFTRRRGRLSRQSTTVRSVPLTAIDSVREAPDEHGPTLVLTIGGSAYDGPPRLVFHVPSGVHLATAIETLRRAARGPPPPEPAAPVQVTVHLPSVPTTTVVLVRCSYCRTVFPELDAKCPSCGAPF